MKRYFNILLGSMLLVVPVLPLYAHADPFIDEPPPTTTAKGAAAATPVAAALETAGYRAQEDVLTDLEDMIFNIATLILVSCALSALITVAMGGQYETAAWFLAGPALFKWIFLTTVSASGTNWQNGSYDPDDTEVKALLGQEEETSYRVSWLFHRYNVLVSSIYQNLIALITDENQSQAMKFTARQRMLDELFRDQIKEGGLMELTDFTRSVCAKDIENARLVALGDRDVRFKADPAYMKAKAEYEAEFSRYKISVSGPVKDYLKEILAGPLDRGLENASNDQGLKVYSNCLNDTKAKRSDYENVEQMVGSPVSCEELFCWNGLGLQNEVLDTQKAAEQAYLQGDANGELRKQIWQDIAAKLTSSGEEGAVERTDADLAIIPLLISGHMLRKHLIDDPTTSAMQELGDRSGVNLKPTQMDFSRMTPEQKQDIMRRHLAHQEAEGLRYELFSFAFQLPYLQGVLLFALGITFPFFALMVLIPGQAGAFFQWMALWAWVKSWDVGWALVSIVDGLLWEMMPHNSYIDIARDPNPGPTTILEAAFAGDPSYSLGNYYMLLGTLLLAVPMVTAEFIIGTKKAMAGQLIQGIRGLSTTYGTSAADYTGDKQVGRTKLVQGRQMLRNAIAADKSTTTGNLMADRAIREQRASANSAISTGSTFTTAGNVGMVGGGIAAAGGLGTAALAGAGMIATGGVGALVVGGIGLASLAAGWTARSVGIDMQRAGNQNLVNAQNTARKFHYYNAAKTHHYRNVEQLRAAVSRGRLEWWFTPDAPTSAFSNAHQMAESLDRYITGKAGAVGGSVVGNAANVITRGRIRASGA